VLFVLLLGGILVAAGGDEEEAIGHLKGGCFLAPKLT
jgi:hypothetical protein